MRLAAGLTSLALAAAPGLVLSGTPSTRAGAAAPGVASHAALQQGEVVCTVDDPRAVELSGLVATAEGYVSVVDSQFDSDQVVIVYLDPQCRVVRTVGYPTPARDPEDLAVAPDGALWVADIGDNVTATERRQTIALWRLPPDGGPAVIHRLTYPDGPHDAEALLFTADGAPVVVTKELGDTTYLYQPTRPLEPGTAQGVPMRVVGEFHPVISAPTNLSSLAEAMVTGAATSPDRTRVALRTYTTAYEWDVPGGDIVQAIAATQPRIIPLPGEPQGEAIAYTMDGQSLLTLSDVAGPTPIRLYPAGPAAPSGTPPPGTATGGTPTALGTVTVAPSRGAWAGFASAVTGLAVLAAALAWSLARRHRHHHRRHRHGP